MVTIMTFSRQVKPILIGVTSDEGSTFVPYLFPGINDGLITWEQLLRGASRTLRKATEETVQAVALKYSVECHGPARHRWAMSRLCGDYFSVCPATESAGKFTQRGSPVYLYSFRHHSSGSVWPRWIGAPHGAELPYVFGTLESVLDVNQTYTQAEAALSSRVMQYWAEFSRSGHASSLYIKILHRQEKGSYSTQQACCFPKGMAEFSSLVITEIAFTRSLLARNQQVNFSPV
uniref:Carboxylesterase type B domain-containing protein n=1 Tax=Varanus komodoensis TaxID=61221 RepID=A0A8D2IRX1_VARKO